MRARATFVLAVAILVAGCMDSGAPQQAPTSAPPPTSSRAVDEPCLLLVVLDEELQPLRANVTIDELNLVVPTNSAGEAKACGIPNGSYHLAVAAAGYDTARKTVSVPAAQPIRFTLRLLPVLVPYHEVLPRSLFHTFSLSTIDSTIARVLPPSNIACSPCSFDFSTPSMPEFVFWEAQWTRSVELVPSEDQMHHVFRGGAPFENAPGDTTDRDVGTGAMTQPFQFQYHRNDMVRSPPVEIAARQGDEVRFSGAMYCWGNPPNPCVNQRIDVFLTAWYNILKIPDDYSALPSS